MSKLNPDDQRDIEKSDAIIQTVIERVVCACVHHDAYECARIRDRFGNMPDPFDDHNPHDQERRACECCCHEKDRDELEDEPW